MAEFTRIDKRYPLGFFLALPDRVRQILVVAVAQARLVIEEIDLARRALHVHVDDPLRPRTEMHARGGHRRRRRPGRGRPDE